jgi:hypothetical protein
MQSSGVPLTSPPTLTWPALLAIRQVPHPDEPVHGVAPAGRRYIIDLQSESVRRKHMPMFQKLYVCVLE